MKEIYLGPTIAEHCIRKISECKRKIQDLQDEIRRLNRILDVYFDSKMLWSEYVASRAENYMKDPLC